MKKLASLARIGSFLVQVVAFFAGIAGAIGLVVNGLYLYAALWVLVVVGVMIVFSRIDTRLHRAAIADVVREVDDPVLGKLVFDEDDGTWTARVERDGETLRFRIGGAKRPSPALIAAANEVLADHKSLRAKVAALIDREASTLEAYADEARRIKLDEVCLTNPRRPRDGMIFFENGDRDPNGLAFRCDYEDGEPKRLGVDT